MSNLPASCAIPIDVNPLSANGFRFSVTRIPEITYFCQRANLPEIALPPAIVDTPLSRIPLTGDKLSYSPLQVEFLIDSKFRNYLALYNWIRGNGFPDDHKQYTEQVNIGRVTDEITEMMATISDATLGILDNTNNVIATVSYRDCVITSLTGLDFSSISSDIQYLTGTATFEYQSYDIQSEQLDILLAQQND